MKLAALFVCNHLEVHQGMVYVHGGFPEWVNVASLPADAQLQVGIVLVLDPAERSSRFAVELKLRREGLPDPLAVYGLEASAAEEGEPVPGGRYLPFPPLAVSVHLEELGTYLLELHQGDQLLGEAHFGVRLVQS